MQEEWQAALHMSGRIGQETESLYPVLGEFLKFLYPFVHWQPSQHFLNICGRCDPRPLRYARGDKRLKSLIS